MSHREREEVLKEGILDAKERETLKRAMEAHRIGPKEAIIDRIAGSEMTEAEASEICQREVRKLDL